MPKQPDRYEDTGRASHIFAAAKRGPRGHGNLSTDELRSVANGIWLCAKHADQVDTNDGKDYPPHVLLSWKAAHEFKFAREHGAMIHPFGWIESLHIVDGPVFKPDRKISLAKTNVIVGENGAGKTAICEWLSSLKAPAPLRRWGAYASDDRMGDTKIAFDVRAPGPHRIELHIAGGRPTFAVDGRTPPFSPVGYEICTVGTEDRWRRSDSDLALIARCLDIDEISVQALAEYMNRYEGVFLKGAGWREEESEESDEPIRSLYCECMNTKGRMVPFRTLSGSASSAVIVDLAIARAKILAEYRPTLLIIETGGLSMGEGFLSLFLDALSSPDTPFQSVVVRTELQDNTVWGGWQVIRLHRPGPLGRGQRGA